MTEEFNIFKNLDDLRKNNLLEQLKSLECNKNDELSNSQELDDSFNFESLVDKNVKKSPTKRQSHKEKATTAENKLKKNQKSRRKSVSSDRSISPAMPLLENLSEKVDKLPIGRRTRRSLQAFREVTEIEKNEEHLTLNNRRNNKKSVRGGTRRRGRNNTTLSNNSDGLLNDSSNSLLHSALNEELASDARSSVAVIEPILPQRHTRSRVMRGRRQYLAEVAARTAVADCIDLITSPVVRVEGFIDLDSDTEETPSTTCSRKDEQENLNLDRNKCNTTNGNLNISYDDENPELNIKVNWKGKPEAFKLRKYQKFCHIFQQLSERENISADSIVFNLNKRIIMPEDTPDSINYKIFQFIDGRVLSNRFNSLGSSVAPVKTPNANNITLKIQSDKWKRPLEINILKSDKFRILYIKCAEELKVSLNQLKLSFDGDLLELNDSAEDLDFEGGEAIDLHMK